MQHNKCTDNLGEFKKFIDSNNKTGICLEEREEVVRRKEKKAPLYGLIPSQRRKQYRKSRDSVKADKVMRLLM
jgi:hypothetical protein